MAVLISRTCIPSCCLIDNKRVGVFEHAIKSVLAYLGYAHRWPSEIGYLQERGHRGANSLAGVSLEVEEKRPSFGTLSPLPTINPRPRREWSESCIE